MAYPNGRTVVAHDAQLTSAPDNILRRSTRERKPIHRYPDVDPETEGG